MALALGSSDDAEGTRMCYTQKTSGKQASQSFLSSVTQKGFFFSARADEDAYIELVTEAEGTTSQEP